MTTTATYMPSAIAGAPVTPGMRQRRSIIRILSGVLMALVGMSVFGIVELRANPQVDVLIVARRVQAGAQLTDGDLAAVRMVPDPAMKVVLARDQPQVVGRTAALPLAAGTLLTPALLADAAMWPPAGQSVIAVGVKTGHAPSGLSPGIAVLIVVIPPSSTTADHQPTAQAAGTVIAVEQADTSGLTVVTVQLPAEAAVRIAAANGDIAIVMQGR